MNMEDLKNVEIASLSEAEVLEHKQKILQLDKDGIIEYLTFAIDNQYSVEDEKTNPKPVETFFNSDEFKPYYKIIMEKDEETVEKSDDDNVDSDE